jgi:hypothetical protein
MLLAAGGGVVMRSSSDLCEMRQQQKTRNRKQ